MTLIPRHFSLLFLFFTALLTPMRGQDVLSEADNMTNSGLLGNKDSTVSQENIKLHWTLSGAIGAHTGGMFQGFGPSGSREISPTIYFSIDRRIGSVLELGFSCGWSKAELFLENNWNGSVYEDVTITAKRISVGAKLLFHYNRVAKSDWYSGLRIGTNTTRRETDTGLYTYSKNDDIFVQYLDRIDQESNTLGLQFILIGYRGYFSENIGAGAELAIGAPYYAAAQLCFRIY